MIELASTIGLFFIIVFLLLFIWKERGEFRKEQGRLIDAVLAKNLEDLAIADTIRKEDKKDPPPPVDPDLLSVDTADEDTFVRIIQEQLKVKDGDTGEDMDTPL